MHGRMGFDALLSFDLLGAGGVAWRIGQHLAIPAAGWATGDDVRVPASSPYGRVVRRAMQRLDLVFYQSRELLDKGAALLSVAPDGMARERHRVLPRGIPTPPALHRSETRKRVRAEWGVTDDQLVILSIGRMTREKGVFELLDAIARVVPRDARAICLLLGSLPAFDESAAIRKKLDATPRLRERVRLLPACAPEHVWDCLCGADLFAFTSYREGMPNSLLEAMAMGVPAVAFAIPSVLELDGGQGAVLTVPPFDASLLAEAIVRLLNSPTERGQFGEQGKARILARYMVKDNMATALESLARLRAHGLPPCSSPLSPPSSPSPSRGEGIISGQHS
jgi:glycosyltransferase involved in cell wall biosynthesis